MLERHIPCAIRLHLTAFCRAAAERLPREFGRKSPKKRQTRQDEFASGRSDAVNFVNERLICGVVVSLWAFRSIGLIQCGSFYAQPFAR